MGEILALMNRENSRVITAIEQALPAIEQACQAVTETIRGGGRVFYVGAGTSGRLGVCDAAECPPTFGVPATLFNGLIAGGESAMFRAAEKVEDDGALSVSDLRRRNLSGMDIVIGISASGSAAYVIAAVEYAKSLSAKTVAITNNPGTALGSAADVSICADTGPEVITGSTRMKAGTAQKIILNMISTTAMIQCGYVYENLMINLRPTNKKLRRRMIGIVCQLARCTEDEAERRLEQADWDIRQAVDQAKDGKSE